MDLKLIQTNTESDRYQELIRSSLEKISPKLLKCDVWNERFALSIPKFVNEHVGSKRPIDFSTLPEPIKLETKLYWCNLLQDERNNSRSIVERRRLPMDWLSEEWSTISSSFGCVSFMSDIPHPEFERKWMPKGNTAGTKEHNKFLIEEFSKFNNQTNRAKQIAEWIKDGELVSKEYLSPRITIIGDFHKKIVMNREQFEPLEKRNVVYLKDLYTEENSRFSDAQQRDDWYINFFSFPDWMRSAVRAHIFSKIENGEIGPLTLRNYFGRLRYFRDFLYEKFKDPSPISITNELIGDDFIAWGNNKKLSGKNWYTDAYAMLISASAQYPDKWPALSVNTRVTRKIENSHYKEGLGRLGYNKEGAGRSYSQNIVDQLSNALKSAPYPTYEIFTMILASGMRAEDGHAVLFDCLHDDPHDPNFKTLTFWQNKVRTWNTKPLSKSDKAHSFLI